jgi:hypothetical protein
MKSAQKRIGKKANQPHKNLNAQHFKKQHKKVSLVTYSSSVCSPLFPCNDKVVITLRTRYSAAKDPSLFAVGVRF